MNYGDKNHYTANWGCATAWPHDPESVCADVGCGLCWMPVLNAQRSYSCMHVACGAIQVSAKPLAFTCWPHIS